MIDDLGFTALDRVAADHLFRFIAAAYEQRSIAITTNVDFERWTQFLPDAATATAILDRFLHHCHVIALDGESFRLREARQVQTKTETPSTPPQRADAQRRFSPATATGTPEASRRAASHSARPTGFAPREAGHTPHAEVDPRVPTAWGIIWPPVGILVGP